MTTPTYGGRDDILDADDRVYEDVVVPEFGGKTYRVRSLTGAERERYESGLGYVKGGRWHATAKGQAMARLVALTIVDGEGRQIFNEDDHSKLARKPAGGLQRIVDVARRLSGLTEEDIDELEGNSEGDPTEDSISTSPSPSVARSPNFSAPSVPAN